MNAYNIEDTIAAYERQRERYDIEAERCHEVMARLATVTIICLIVRGAIGAMQRIVHYYEKLDYIKSAHNIVYDKYSKKTCDMDLNQLPKSIKQLLFEIKSPIDI